MQLFGSFYANHIEIIIQKLHTCYLIIIVCASLNGLSEIKKKKKKTLP